MFTCLQINKQVYQPDDKLTLSINIMPQNLIKIREKGNTKKVIFLFFNGELYALNLLFDCFLTVYKMFWDRTNTGNKTETGRDVGKILTKDCLTQ